MSFKRTTLTGLAALVLGTSVATANDYPTKNIMVIVPFPAGGSTDLMARATAREMSEFFGKNIMVDNHAGGAGTVGLANIARLRPDGYTVGIVPAATLVNQPHMRRTPYDLDSFDYICQLFFSPQALAVKPGSPFKSLKELVDHAKANPGTLSYGSPGPGSLPHLAMEQFLDLAGIKINHVPFTGDGPGTTALLGGHIDLYMTMTNVVRDKDLTAIGIFSDTRLDMMADLPTAKEQGFDMVASWWGGVVAPKGIPATAKTRLDEACQYAAKSERFAETLDRLGTMVQYRGPDDFQAYVNSVSEVNGRLIERVLKSNSGN